MTQDLLLKELRMVIHKCETVILYKPMMGEVDYRNNLPITLPKQEIFIPRSKTSNPYQWAEKCRDDFEERCVCILIPGTRFDLSGTRHGRGGGWYDRFLSRVPRRWVRIGLINETNLSKTFIKRESWDEPVDWVLSLNTKGLWNIHRTKN